VTLKAWLQNRDRYFVVIVVTMLFVAVSQHGVIGKVLAGFALPISGYYFVRYLRSRRVRP